MFPCTSTYLDLTSLDLPFTFTSFRSRRSTSVSPSISLTSSPRCSSEASTCSSTSPPSRPRYTTRPSPHTTSYQYQYNHALLIDITALKTEVHHPPSIYIPCYYISTLTPTHTLSLLITASTATLTRMFLPHQFACLQVPHIAVGTPGRILDLATKRKVGEQTLLHLNSLNTNRSPNSLHQHSFTFSFILPINTPRYFHLSLLSNYRILRNPQYLYLASYLCLPGVGSVQSEALHPRRVRSPARRTRHAPRCSGNIHHPNLLLLNTPC